MVNFLPKEYYDRFFSNVSKTRVPGPSECHVPHVGAVFALNFFSRRAVQSLMPLEKTPGIISMLAGKPNASTFPFTSIQLTARSPVDPTKEEILTLGPKELETALQYGPTAGIPSLLEWIWGLQEFSHGRKPDEGWKPSVGAGSQDVIYKVRGCLRYCIIHLTGPAGCQLYFEPRGSDFGGISRICVRI